VRLEVRQLIELTPTEYKLAVLPARQCEGRVLTREQILAQVWDYTFTSKCERARDLHQPISGKKWTCTSRGRSSIPSAGVGYTLRLPSGQEQTAPS